MEYGDGASAFSSRLYVEFGYSNSNKHKVGLFLRLSDGGYPETANDYTCYPETELTSVETTFIYDVVAGRLSKS